MAAARAGVPRLFVVRGLGGTSLSELTGGAARLPRSAGLQGRLRRVAESCRRGGAGSCAAPDRVGGRREVGVCVSSYWLGLAGGGIFEPEGLAGAARAACALVLYCCRAWWRLLSRPLDCDGGPGATHLGA